jgi:hypothetical protein
MTMAGCIYGNNYKTKTWWVTQDTSITVREVGVLCEANIILRSTCTLTIHAGSSSSPRPVLLISVDLRVAARADGPRVKRYSPQ